MKMNGAQLTIQLLERQGVRIVAGIPGGAILPIYDALSQSRRIRHVLARHEQGAGFIAQGMARATGMPAVCMASSGPGVTNLLTAIADAKLDSIPLVAITGQVPRNMIGTDAFQEVDAYGLSIPVTKHTFMVASARELLHVIPRAFEITADGRPGPVWVDIPKDVQNEMVEVGEEFAQTAAVESAAAIDEAPSFTIARGDAEHAPRQRTRYNAYASPIAGAGPGDTDMFDDRTLAQAARLINEAERPVLYLGGGIIHSPGAAALAVELAETAQLPATMTLMALGAMPADHPLALGMLGMHAARYTNLILEECDLLIAAGARFDDRATGDANRFCPNAKIVHIDIDPAELNKIKRAHIGIAGDAGRVLAALLPRVASGNRAGWLDRVAELKRSHPLVMDAPNDPRTHYGLIRAVAECLDDSAIVTTDVGQHQMWVAQAYPLRRSRQWITSGGLGTMGFGVPAAIGAALAMPDRTVVCFTGDGSLLMNIQELATAADEEANVKIVLMNNNSLGLVHQQQELFYGKRIFASLYPAQTDFLAVARGFGISAIDLDMAADPRRALQTALRRPGPCLIHVTIDVCAKVFPMVPPGAANCDMIGGTP
jgi:acetolactate synthase-1/2/3 large subunit